MKKTTKLFFEEKNEPQISGFVIAKTAPTLSKTIFLKKKIIQLICADMIFQTLCGNFFEINGSRDIYVSVILRFPKIVLHNKITSKI